MEDKKISCHPAGETSISAIADSVFFFCKDQIINIGSVITHVLHLLVFGIAPDWAYNTIKWSENQEGCVKFMLTYDKII